LFYFAANKKVAFLFVFSEVCLSSRKNTMFPSRKTLALFFTNFWYF
jgi:hypothetical protein